VRQGRQIVFLVLAASAASTVPVYAAVVETVNRAPYAVTGSTEAEVRADINAKRSGGYDARVIWYFRWTYTYRNTASGCSMERVTVALELTMIEPVLRTADAGVQKSFEAYMAKLRVHEQGHTAIARATAKRIDAALQPLTAPSCDALGKRANEMGHALVKEGNAAQAAYDTRTDHGATQGARWPRAAKTTAPPAPPAATPYDPGRSRYQASDPPLPRPASD